MYFHLKFLADKVGSIRIAVLENLMEENEQLIVKFNWIIEIPGASKQQNTLESSFQFSISSSVLFLESNPINLKVFDNSMRQDYILQR